MAQGRGADAFGACAARAPKAGGWTEEGGSPADRRAGAPSGVRYEGKKSRPWISHLGRYFIPHRTRMSDSTVVVPRVSAVSEGSAIVRLQQL